MKKFIKKRAGDLSPDDVVVMANNVTIRIASSRVTEKTAMVLDARQNVYEWATSYVCYTLNPNHPEFEIC